MSGEAPVRNRQSEGGYAKETSKEKKARIADDRQAALEADLMRIVSPRSPTAYLPPPHFGVDAADAPTSHPSPPPTPWLPLPTSERR